MKHMADGIWTRVGRHFFYRVIETSTNDHLVMERFAAIRARDNELASGRPALRRRELSATFMKHVALELCDRLGEAENRNAEFRRDAAILTMVFVIVTLLNVVHLMCSLGWLR